VGLGIYSYRAFKQMDEDWEDYYEKLEEYRRVTGLDPDTTSERSATTTSTTSKSSGDELDSLFTGGTLAIDLGSSKLKLAHLPSRNKVPNAKPAVTVDREGARSTPSLIWMSHDETLVGRMADTRMYDLKGGHVLKPREILMNDNADDSQVTNAVQQTIRMAAGNALEQVLGGEKSTSNTSPLFVVDQTMAYSGSYNVRPVFTYPNDAVLERYQRVLQNNNLTSPEGIALFVPEPVAVVKGAEYYNLLPAKMAPVLVVDVGGSFTSISVVLDKKVLFSSSMPFGGNTFVDLLTNHLIQHFYGNETERNETSISTLPTLNDPAALQRLYEASVTALHELSNKSRSQINIPYLSIDLQTKQPKHLEIGVPRSIVDTKVEAFVRERLIDYLMNDDTASSFVLSNSLPRPTDLSTLFSSALACAMEQTSQTPLSLRAILLVGGGARIPLVRDAMKRGAELVGGDMFASSLVIPEGELVEELAVLGAAVWGSGSQ
jgi:molecular chaperone DnaK